MKILNDKKYGSHVNFIDDNDVFVGYDVGQSCCEEADWYITDKLIPYTYDWRDNHVSQLEKTPDMSAYYFDKEFFQEIESNDLDAGGMVAFKLVADGKPDLYLHLYNAHNGYYGHGFEVKHSDKIVREGYL